MKITGFLGRISLDKKGSAFTMSQTPILKAGDRVATVFNGKKVGTILSLYPVSHDICARVQFISETKVYFIDQLIKK